MKQFFFLFFLSLSSVIIAQSVPYKVNTRKFPLGNNYNKILAPKVGEWERFAFHDFVPGQELGHVYYNKGKKQLYVEFGKALSFDDMKTEWLKIYYRAVDGRESEVKQKNMTSTSTKYIVIQGASGYYFAWTRNLFYFTIQAKNKEDVDDFMTFFPW